MAALKRNDPCPSAWSFISAGTFDPVCNVSEEDADLDSPDIETDEEE